MIGKKLHQLLQDLSVSERRSLLNICKRSDDKRHGQLDRLLRAKNTSEASFVKTLNKIGKELKESEVSEQEREKNLRRFVDFAAKEIENLKLKQLLGKDLKLRNYLLSLSYDQNETKRLKNEYLSKANTYALKDNDYWVQRQFLEHRLKTTLQNQTVNDIKEFRKSVGKKRHLVQWYYQLEMAQIYDFVSSTFLDDKTSLDEFGDYISSNDNFDALIKLAIGYSEATGYKLAQARFNFENPVHCKLYIEEAEQLQKKCQEGKTKDIVRRKIVFLKFLYAFHYGESYDVLRALIREAQDINEKYQNEDPKIVFYLILIEILEGNNTDQLLEKYQGYFASPKVAYMQDLLVAIGAVRNGDLKKAKRLLLDVSYCSNPYLAVWSRLLEIVINLNQGNEQLVDSLIDRAKRQMQNNINRIFTFNSSDWVLNEVYKITGHKHIVEPKEMQNYPPTVIHEFITSLINK